MAGPQKLDISTLTESGALILREEKPEEMTVRLAKETADANHTRWKDRWLFIGSGTVGLSAFVVSVCLAILSSDTDTRKWAQSIVGLLLAGLVGYLMGKK